VTLADRRLVRIIALSILALLLTGCATFSPVDGYQGPTATLEDSYQWTENDSCGSFFFLYEYDGHGVDNALQATAQANAGRGFRMSPKGASRPVPARDATFHINGRTHCAAPIQELVGTVYLVHGNVRFTPAAGATYVITGELAADHSAVWIEDKATHAQVGNKLLIKGLAKAGLFDQSSTPEQIPPGN
jgi:hypothetical protein